MLARNWRCDIGEIDLVVLVTGAGRRRSAAAVAIVEVKARRSDRYGVAASAVDERKQTRLRRLAARWLAEHRELVDRIGAGAQVDVRFDVVAITGTAVEVIEHAF